MKRKPRLGGMPLKITQREIAEGSIMPRWYALAYWDHYHNVMVCYPVGIHLVVQAYEWLRWRVTRAKHFSFMRAPIRLAYHAGYKDAADRCQDEVIKGVVLEVLETLKKEMRP